MVDHESVLMKNIYSWKCRSKKCVKTKKSLLSEYLNWHEYFKVVNDPKKKIIIRNTSQPVFRWIHLCYQWIKMFSLRQKLIFNLILQSVVSLEFRLVFCSTTLNKTHSLKKCFFFDDLSKKWMFFRKTFISWNDDSI